jgi:hypothetical protein
METTKSDFFNELAKRATTNPTELKSELIEQSKSAPGQVQGLLASLSITHPEFVREVSSALV